MKVSVRLISIASPIYSAVLLCSIGSAFAAAPAGHMPASIERLGTSLGQESPSTPLHLSVWLNLHNKSDLDARVARLYTPGSPTFHQWLNIEDLKRYAPTAAEVSAVEAELSAHNLKVTGADALGLSVRFTGTASDVERAFNTQITRYKVKGQLVRITSSEPTLGGQAAGLVQHLGGLNSLAPTPATVAPIDPHTGKASAGFLLPKNSKGAVSTSGSSLFLNHCFSAPSTVSFSGYSSVDGSTPLALTYSGLTYGAEETSTSAGYCSYAPSDIRKIYGLNKAYAKGVKGAGQTIVIVDPYLEPTIQSDMDVFTATEGLSSFTLTLLNPFGTTESAFEDGTGWNIEAAIDTQWAHSVAPAAKVVLLEAFSNDFEDLQFAVLYAVEHGLGNVVSNSYSAPESLVSPLTKEISDEIDEFGASQGVSIAYATGDDGDLTNDGIPADVPFPASSPYSVAVGGTSVVLTGDDAIETTGWGTNVTYLGYQDLAGDNIIEYPPLNTFRFGAGGGVSSFFAKPSYQSALSGPGRHLPDVSAIADPETGCQIIYSDGLGNQYISGYGGTSLATPIFSGMWALIDEAAGYSLGLASPYVAAAPAPYIEDVLPISGPSNVSGFITTPTGDVNYSATDLAEPLGLTTVFTSALYSYGPGGLDVFTFGTDSGLLTTQGWDNVTGYGTPNTGAIVEALKQ